MTCILWRRVIHACMTAFFLAGMSLFLWPGKFLVTFTDVIFVGHGLCLSSTDPVVYDWM